MKGASQSSARRLSADAERPEVLDASGYPIVPPSVETIECPPAKPLETFLIASDVAGYLRRRALDLHTDPATILNDLVRVERRRTELG